MLSVFYILKLSDVISCIKSQISHDETLILTNCEKPKIKHKSLDITLEGRDSGILDAFSKFIQATSESFGGICGNPYVPAVRFEKWTVLSSPHVHKTARTQFERRTHKRQLIVHDLHVELVPRMIWYLRQHAPPDVKVDCNVHRYIALEE